MDMWQKAKNIYHLACAIIANVLYGFPARKAIVIGVTGTDGKTTTVNLIYHILKTAGMSVSMVSTVGANIRGDKSNLAFHVTTPNSFTLQKFLSQAVKGNEEKKYVVLEVSSHSIDQYRIWGIPFFIGVITNITNEHLDYHKTYDMYLKTKARLISRAQIAILNRDDSSYTKLLPFVKNKKYITFGKNGNADITPVFLSKSQLIGEFNTYNMLASVSVAISLGIEEKIIKKALATFVTPNGRMNEITNSHGVHIFIDYAHTPNGLYQALTALETKRKKGAKIIALVGAEGKRDPGKRTEIGKIAGKFADIVIITGVDPRGEADKINQAILLGAQEMGKMIDKTVFVIPDRKEAIERTLHKFARKGDVVGLFGKGHERSMNYDGHHEIPWNDEAVVKQILYAKT